MITKKTYMNALRDALPDIVVDDDLALSILDVVFSVPMKGLENGDKVELPGLGFISIDRSRGAGCLSYSPEDAHITCGLSPRAH